MGMCRIYLTSGAIMHLPADEVEIDHGHLILSKDPNELVAEFAPGVWAYWLWTEMTSA